MVGPGLAAALDGRSRAVWPACQAGRVLGQSSIVGRLLPDRMTSSKDTFPSPVFVGGSARTGTHAMGRLVGASRRYHPIAVESRFHAAKGGLCDVLDGKSDVESFLDRVRNDWWKRGLREQTGLQSILDPERRDEALERFRVDVDREPWEAGRRLVHGLLDPSAEAAGKPSWVEVTGGNIRSAPTLLRLFPRARFINMFRDGRAVVGGIINKTDMPDDPSEALDHWEARIRSADRAMRKLPPQAVMVLPLDDLTALDRDRTYERLAEFLELGDDPSMRAYFDEHISGDRAHVGQWRERMPPPEARRVDRRYRKLVRQLHREGVTWVPDPGPGGLRLGPVRIPVPGRS
jgi:hypothetical protein